jgi:ABC-2 type transport system ATP-binding protein
MQSGGESSRGRTVLAQHTGGPSVPMGSPPLEVRNLSKRYGSGTWANRDINLTGNQAEILGILGPNGAGKTTLVRQITTELLPTSGSVRVLGHDAIRDQTQVKALLGIVPQEAVLFNYLTVYQHLRILAKLRGLKPRAAGLRADRLIIDLDLIGHRDVAVANLSGGMKRRVMLGIASIAQPPVMVLDEPTTGLDPQSRRSLWSLLRQHREEGAFVLLTTHSMEEAEALCDRVAIIQSGRLLVVDTVKNLCSNHGFKFKITYFTDEFTEDGVTLFGADQPELIARVRAMGVQQFSVGRTNLEDVYLAMTSNINGFDDGTS